MSVSRSNIKSQLTPPLGEKNTPPTCWVVIPCYNEEEVLPETARRLSGKFSELIDNNQISPSSRILLVDDGSHDQTWQIISALHEGRLAGPELLPGQVCGISLAHNAGHQNALYAGLMQALSMGCDCAISMDADLQDDIEVIDGMLEEYANGAEIVYGVRSSRKSDTAFKRVTAEAFYSVMSRMGVELIPNSADCRLMGRQALEALSHYQEVNLFLRGIVPALGFTSANVYYERAERFAGESKYPLRKMINFALEGITSFSVQPIRAILLLGCISVLLALAMVVYALLSRARGSAVPGWTSIMVSIWLVGGLIMISLGVVGEYVGKAYLETKRRPRYIVREVLE